MDSSFDVSDSSDWLGTPVSKLAPVETALRCQVCKDFFTSPVITSCSHTFCSLCIRRCLTSDGKCPTCRAVDQELRLRPNWIVQELVDAFQTARPLILQLVEDVAQYSDVEKRGRKKRKLEIADACDEGGFSGSTTHRGKTKSQDRGEAFVDIMNGDTQTGDGLIPCPICGRRMKEEEVFPHLDIHNESEGSRETAVENKAVKGSQPFPEKASRSRTQAKVPLERLPQLNYSLLNDNALRRKLSSLGMPSHGPRGLLVRRHTEWVNLVNSNSDSRTPKSKRELLHELDIWERSQGRQIVNNGFSGPSVMDKDFDGAEWASKHDSNFQKLITEARKKTKAQKVMVNTIEGHGDELVPVEAEVENGTALEKQRNDRPIPDETSSPTLNSPLSHRHDQSGTGVFVDLDAGA